MIRTLLGVLLPLLIWTQQQRATSVVVPQFSCWFPTYEPSVTGDNATLARVYNYVFGYTNGGTTEVQEPLGADNTLTLGHGAQPDVLLVGAQPFDFVVKDARPTGVVVWRLLGQDAISSQSPQSRCDVRYQGVCPLDMAHFCDDALYCNGVQECYSPHDQGEATPHNVTGHCAAPAHGVLCSGGAQCSETALGCVVTTAPTMAPSAAPTHTPTAVPTADPAPQAVLVPLLQCWMRTTSTIRLIMLVNNTASVTVTRPVTNSTGASPLRNHVRPQELNGAQATTFAPGVQQAFVFALSANYFEGEERHSGIAWFLSTQRLRVTSGDLTAQRHCNATPSDDPVVTPPPTRGVQWAVVECATLDANCSQLDSFCAGPSHCDVELGRCVHSATHQHACPGPEGAPLSMLCVDHLQLCVEVVDCVLNSDCNDGDLCTGEEWCSNGTCEYQNDTSVLAICGTEQAVCEPNVGCTFTGYAISNAAIVGLVVGGCVLLVLIAVALYFYVSYVDAQQEAPRIRARKKRSE